MTNANKKRKKEILWQFKNNSWNKFGKATKAQIEALKDDYRLNIIILVDERN